MGELQRHLGHREMVGETWKHSRLTGVLGKARTNSDSEGGARRGEDGDVCQAAFEHNLLL